MTTKTDSPPLGAPLLLHTAITGHELRFAPDPAVDQFLDRLRAMLADPAATSQEMTGLAYSTANPLLAPAPGDLAGDRGLVTREVLDDPRYRVAADLIARKRFAETGTDPARAAEAYTVSITEAQRLLGLSQSAVWAAFNEGRIPTWVKDGRPFATPHGVAAYGRLLATSGKKRPGRAPARPVEDAAPPPPTRLVVRMGHGPEGALKLARVGELADVVRVGGNVVEGHLDTWKRVAVLVGAGEDARFYELAPAPGANETLAGAGGFFVRGGFKIVQAIHTAKKSRALWGDFEPA